jgi:hypothetical protein
MIGKSIYSILNADATLVSLVGNDAASGGIKVYPMIAPQDTQVPFIVYETLSNDPTPSKDGASKVDRLRIQITAFDNDNDNLYAIIERVRVIIDDLRTTNLGNEIDKIWFDDRVDAYDTAGDLFIVSDTYNLRLKL